ncbi:MAG TPA: isoprenylcysteine carboxylmethyltransferase family protein [Rhizobiaceae bacterium]|jgi:protein-S-isoprenylcysteine O-methyltransferase Ste14|nr:isoprenylcysteine carboxylmethyltransferase family protein [Rhizobiaceae bacterium]
MSVGHAIVLLWVLFALSWVAAAFWADRAEKTAGFSAELPYRAILAVGAILFFIPAHGYNGWLRIWYPGLALAWICVALIAIGFLFAWWARLHLGRLWSGYITRKSGHHIVDTGPYGLVRHPIYTGLLLAVIATMIAKGTVPGILGAILIVIGVFMKARLEERFLRAQLGAASYDAYKVRVPMLVPFM